MRKILNKLSILFIVFILIASPQAICDDIDYEALDVDSEVFTSSSRLEKNITEPDVNSRACVVIDKKTNTILYGKNEKQKRKMASTTKIMTAIVVLENTNLDDIVTINLEETIEISKKAAGTGGSRLGLKTGDKITIRDLLYGLMMRSGNDAAVALAEYCRWKH